MINNINKNISVWRGDNTPPTEYHVWIKSNGSVLINRDGTWFTQISESTNDSVNVCNLSDSHHLTLEEALDIVAQYLGKDVFHAGYKIRFNVNTESEKSNVWKEYIFTSVAGSILYKVTKFWKLLATSDLFDSNGEIRSQYLPSYVDDVLEFTSIDLFPEAGESDKIYVDTSTNKSYRWSGTQYVLIALTDIVTADTMGLMSPEMYQKLEKTASDLDIHDRQNQVDFAEIRQSLDQKVSKIVDSQGNIISNNASIATIPDGTSDTRGLLTPAIYKQVEDNKKMSEYLDDNKVEEIRNLQGTPFPKIGSIVTIPNATSQSAGLMTSDDKIKLDSIESGSGSESESEFVKDLGLVASTNEGDQMAAKSEIAGNVKISFIRYRTAGVSAEEVTTIFQWRNGINETAQIKFVDKAQWRRNVTGATGIAGATTTPTMWERTGAHYLGYDAASRTLQLKDYNQTVIRTVQLPLAQNDADAVIDGLVSSADIASFITDASFNALTGELQFNNKTNSLVTCFAIPTATQNGKGLMSESDVIAMGSFAEHTADTSNPHQVTKSQVGLSKVTNDAQVKRSEMGVANGVALLNSEGKISSSYLPSYVSDVITADSYGNLPTTGEEDKIYVTKDTNLTYRWSGTAYVEISPSIALGETSTTAYAGDKGKALSNSVTDLQYRVGGGWVVTDNVDFAIIGTGDTRVEIAPGARILASVVGQGTSFTISSNTDTASIGYGASIGQNSVLGAGLSAFINNVTGPGGSTRQGIVLKDVNDDNSIKILGRNNGEFLVGTSVNNNNWIDLARLDKISTMIESTTDGLVFYPNRLIGNDKETSIILGTRTAIGENVHIGSDCGISNGVNIFAIGEQSTWVIGTISTDSPTNIQTAYIGYGAQISNYVEVSASIRDDGTGYILLGDRTTKIKKGVTIDGNSGSSEQLVHEDQESWLIGKDPTSTKTNVILGKGIVITGTNKTNQPILIKAQNRNNATALIGANFNAYSGVTLGSYSSLGNQAKLGDNVEIIQGESGLVIVSNDYGMTIGSKVRIRNNVSLGNNVIISDDISISTNVLVSDTGDEVSVGDVTISTGIRITKNASATTIQNGNDSNTSGGKLQFGTDNIIWDGVEIGTGVHITEDLTFDSTSYKLGGTNQTTIGKNLNISGNVDQVDVLLKPSEGAAGKIKIQDTIGNANWLTLENRNNILAGEFYGGSMSTIWSGVEIGTGVKITEDLIADSTSYKLGETNQVTISKGIDIYCSDTEHALKIIAPTTDGASLYSFGKVELGTNFQVSSDVSLGISLGTGSIDAVSYYQLKDPKSQLLTSSIGAGVTIQSGIQIKESDSGGIQIYVPSQDKWITIS